MTQTAASAAVLLNRILSLKESSPFILALDTLQQSSFHLTHELVHKVTSGPEVPIVYLSFETTNKPSYADVFVPCLGLKMPEIAAALAKFDLSTKTLVIVDSFNYLLESDLNKFLGCVISPQTVIYGTYHASVPATRQATRPNSPSLLSRLSFVATTMFHLKPVLSSAIDEETLDHMTSDLDLAVGIANQPVFDAQVVYRRKSGRSLVYEFTIDTSRHEYKIRQTESGEQSDEAQLLEGLTTFNLTTTQRQKIAKNQVDLPFLEAQQSLGSVGGAIVYEFEKDDDYDEEDPYEDPF